MNIKLNNRLLTVASLVEEKRKIIDVGCDHAFLSIYLVQNKKPLKVIASDINDGPLLHATENVKKYQLEDSIKVKLGNGVEPIEDDIDNIIGVLHIKDAFPFWQKNEIFRTSIKDIPGLISEVDFIPETININTLFTKMQTEKSHMYIVIDEYGQTSGLVAMEDILEEIVGNIEDEHDEEENPVFLQSDGSYTVDGLTELRDVLEVLDLPVEEDAFETLNGLLISLLEKVPNDGEQEIIKAYGYQFEICNVEDRIIRNVRITKERNLATNDKE